MIKALTGDYPHKKDTPPRVENDCFSSVAVINFGLIVISLIMHNNEYTKIIAVRCGNNSMGELIL